MYVTHDRVHCHWRWLCHIPLFASFENWMKASSNAMVWLLRLSHLLPGVNFLSGNLIKVFENSPCDLEDHVWSIIWLWWDRTCRICSIVVTFALKSEEGMLKMWVHKTTRAENNPSNHYQSKYWSLAMLTQTFKCNFSVSCLIIRHSFIWITIESIHCRLLSQFSKLAKSGICHCHLQWQNTRSCVTYMMQEGYQWKEDELLFSYRPHANNQVHLVYRIMDL